MIFSVLDIFFLISIEFPLSISIRINRIPIFYIHWLLLDIIIRYIIDDYLWINNISLSFQYVQNIVKILIMEIVKR